CVVRCSFRQPNLRRRCSRAAIGIASQDRKEHREGSDGRHSRRMSVVGEEIMGSRGGTDKNLQRKYTVQVASSSTPEEDVLDWVYSNAPVSLAGLVLNSISLEESEEVQNLYEATAQYSELEKKDKPP